MKKNDCFWLTSIRGQGATEYWCDRDDEECFDPDCDECMRYLTIISARIILRNLIEFTENIQDIYNDEVKE